MAPVTQTVRERFDLDDLQQERPPLRYDYEHEPGQVLALRGANVPRRSMNLARRRERNQPSSKRLQTSLNAANHLVHQNPLNADGFEP